MNRQNNFTININGKIIDLSSPKVMTIINVTPDSFWSDSRNNSEHQIAASVESAISEGAAIIDIGGYSTRPGASFVTTEEEMCRVLSALKTIKSSHGDLPIPISIDTFRSEVVERVLEEYGKVIVNDISSGDDDHKMLPLVGANKLPYIAMHKKGTPQTMCSMNNYSGDIVADIIGYFATKTKEIKSYGIDDLILDIGFGFAKDLNQNFALLRRYDEFKVMGLPTLAGISRKRMIWQTLGVEIENSLNGTSALHLQLLQSGASILRVHDTKEAVEIVKLHKILMNELP